MSKAPGENGVALYFPYLTISDQSWLFGSLCLWETVRCIVPAGLQVDDPEWLTPLKSEGLVKQADTRHSLADARSRLLAAITPPGTTVPAVGDEARRLLRSRFEVLSPGSKDIVLIHGAKGEEQTWTLLVESELAENDDHGNVRVARPVGELYMTCLATAMGKCNGTPLITDKAEYVDWCRRIELKTPSPGAAGEPLLAEVAALGLDWPDTAAFAEVQPSKFCKFHSQSAAARSTFRSFLLAMREERAAARSTEEDEDVVQRLWRDLNASHEEVLAKIAELGVKRVGTVLSLVASVLKPRAIPDKLLAIGKDNAERRTALSQMYKNPGYYTYLVRKNWL